MPIQIQRAMQLTEAVNTDNIINSHHKILEEQLTLALN